ncbi:MAG TPA: DUF2254 domain-containing protein [Pyrinomonadaceae bacterium]|nr:DUF2254 domain-containing protein [Pyrinomonadaceae bacterium]
MNWSRRHRIRLFVSNSIWIFPALSIFLALATVAVLSRLERLVGWEISMSREIALAVMSTIAASMFTLVALASSAVLLTVQLASAQLTPRIIALVYRSGARKLSLAIFVFTFTFSLGVLVRLESVVPALTGYLAAYGFLLSLMVFLFFVDGVGKSLRPSSALRNVGLIGREVIREVYPRALAKSDAATLEPIQILANTPDRIVANSEDGVLLAFDLMGLVSLAERHSCLIELMPGVGDFVASGDPLFRIFQGGEGLSDDALLDSVAIGHERSLEQDPMFAFRIVVDIAIKALSPAINDPTTAVLAIDQIHHLLRDVGNRFLAEGHATDSSGQVRLVYRTPNWEDFVHLAITEIRQYGSTSIQVTRRLRTMLDNLIETLPERRAPVLREALEQLVSSSKRAFSDMDDQLMSVIGDLQGLGGGQDQNLLRQRIAIAMAQPAAPPDLRAMARVGKTKEQ